MMAMSAAKALARELKGVVTPTIDRYRIAKYTAEALAAHTKEETLTTETAYSAFLEGSMVLYRLCNVRVLQSNQVRQEFRILRG